MNFSPTLSTTLSRGIYGPAEVSHQMKYIDTSFHLFHELVRRTEVLVAGDVRRAFLGFVVGRTFFLGLMTADDDF